MRHLCYHYLCALWQTQLAARLLHIFILVMNACLHSVKPTPTCTHAKFSSIRNSTEDDVHAHRISLAVSILLKTCTSRGAMRNVVRDAMLSRTICTALGSGSVQWLGGAQSWLLSCVHVVFARSDAIRLRCPCLCVFPFFLPLPHFVSLFSSFHLHRCRYSTYLPSL